MVLSSRAMVTESNSQASSRSRFRSRYMLLLLPYAALCFPEVYARTTPEIFGFPFFYWYQFLWVILTSALLWIYYKLATRAE